MRCEVCHKKDGEYQCKDCSRVICEDCMKYTPEGVFCKECKKDIIKKKRTISSGSKTMKTLFITLLFLSIGLGGILYVGLQFIDALGGDLNLLNMPIESMKNSAYIIIGGMIALTAIIGIMYLLSRRVKGI